MSALFDELIVAAAIAAAGAYVVTGATSACGPVQPPNPRSSHATPTPISGGLGVVFGVGAALLALALSRPADMTDGFHAATAARLPACLFLALAAAALGALDDLLVLGARLKLVVLAAVAIGMALAAGPPPVIELAAGLAAAPPAAIGLGGAALWAFVAMNAVNFIDGANGVAGGSLAIASAGMAAAAALTGAGEAALLAAAAAGGFAGFLPWNTPQARVFMGDVGALFGGALFASAALIWARHAPVALFAAPLLIAPILADVLLTLAWRAQAGRSVLSAHREHAYQLRLRAGASHLEVSRAIARRTLIWTIAAVAAVAAVAAGAGAWIGLLALAVGLAAEARAWARTDRRALVRDDAQP